MTILHDLLSLYNNLPTDSVYHAVIAILFQNLPLLPNLSLEETAELCNTSIITINRLLKKIDCPSFRAFKQRIGDVTRGYNRHNRVFPYEKDSYDSPHLLLSLSQYINGLSQYIVASQMEQIAELIHQSNDIRFYCKYAGSHAKQQFQLDLMYSGKKTTALSSSKEQIPDSQTLTSDSLVIATLVSSAKDYPTTLNLLKNISSSDAALVVISPTNTPDSVKHADHLIQFKGSDTALDNYIIDLIFNILCIAYCNKYID